MTTSVESAARTAVGQTHLPLASAPHNSGPPTSTQQDRPRMLPKPAVSRCAPSCAKPLFEQVRTHNDMAEAPVGQVVGCSPGPSIFYLFFSCLRQKLAERVGFEPTVRKTVHLISSQAHSTTLAPLRSYIRSRHCPRGGEATSADTIGVARWGGLLQGAGLYAKGTSRARRPEGHFGVKFGSKNERARRRTCA